MDEFDLSDDDLFSDPVFDHILAQAQSHFQTPTASQHAPLEELDDALLDVESFSQALARAEQPSKHPAASYHVEPPTSISSSRRKVGHTNWTARSLEPVTPSPSKYQNIATSDEFETSDLSDDGLLVALEPVTSTKKRGLTPDETRSTKKARTEVQPANFAQINRERPLALKFKPWTKVPPVGDDDFGVPDFEDPEVIAALEDVRKHTIIAQIPESTTDTVQITRAELEALTQNAFIAGQANSHRMWRRKYVFDFFKLPAELRLAIYGYALQDTNPATANKQSVEALPARSVFVDEDDDLHQITWTAPEKKPWINLSLLRTCKRVYGEVRNDILFKDRKFEARVSLDSSFGSIMRTAHKLVFWQHIQHLHLVLRPVNNSFQWRRHVNTGIEGLMALTRGGKRLKSFHLCWESTQLSEKIEMFGNLQLSGSIVLTQHFDDQNVKAGEDKEVERTQRIRETMLNMQGLRPDDTTEYDVLPSWSASEIGKRSQMQIRMSTR